jgi:hypothetical protein
LRPRSKSESTRTLTGSVRMGIRGDAAEAPQCLSSPAHPRRQRPRDDNLPWRLQSVLEGDRGAGGARSARRE